MLDYTNEDDRGFWNVLWSDFVTTPRSGENLWEQAYCQEWLRKQGYTITEKPRGIVAFRLHPDATEERFYIGLMLKGKKYRCTAFKIFSRKSQIPQKESIDFAGLESYIKVAMENQ